MMNRHDFFKVLIKELKGIELSELQDVLRYYNEYFDDAGLENEQAVLKELGSPIEIADAIKLNSLGKGTRGAEPIKKTTAKTVWAIIGMVFVAPIVIPIALALAVVAISLVIVYAALIFSFFAISVAFALAGALIMIVSFLTILQSPPTFMLMLGAGLVLMGLSILIWIPTLALAKVSIRGMVKICERKTVRREIGNE